MNSADQTARAIAQVILTDPIAAGLVKEYINVQLLASTLGISREHPVYLRPKSLDEATEGFDRDEINDYCLTVACQRLSFWRIVKAKLKALYYA